METNPSNIHICPTDVRFDAWWYYADGIDTDVKYRCLRMLDWLVSTDPKLGWNELSSLFCVGVGDDEKNVFLRRRRQANGRDVKDPEKLQKAIEESGDFIVFKIQGPMLQNFLRP